MAHQDALALAGRVGLFAGRKPASIYMQGMQGAYLLLATGRDCFDDMQMVRTRRHSFLYGPPGVSKSTTGKFFLKQCIGAIEHGFPNPHNKPTYYTMGGSGTWEKARGTFNASDGTIVEPRFCNADYVFMPEYPAFLTHSPSARSERIDYMNVAMEEGDMVVDLVKAAAMPLEKRLELAKNIPADANYEYEPRYATLYYKATCNFIAASRFFDAKELESMENSGHWSRWSVDRWEPSAAELEAYADDRFGVPNPDDVAALKQLNEDIWGTEFLEVNAPPRSLVTEVVRSFNQKYQEICDQFGCKFQDVVGLRDDTDAAQLIAISAIARLMEGRTAGDRTPIPRIEYTALDVKRAQRMAKSRMDDLYNHHLMNSKDATKHEDLALANVAGYLEQLANDQAEGGETPWPCTFRSKDFVAHWVAKGKGERTARRWVGSAMEAGALGKGYDAGVYQVGSSFLKRLGYKEPQE